FVVELPAVLRFSAEGVDERRNGGCEPAPRLEFENGAEDQMSRLVLVHGPFQFGHDAEAEAVFLPRDKNRDELGTEFFQAHGSEIVCLAKRLRLVDPLLLQLDAHPRLEPAGDSGLQFERMAGSDDAVLVEHDSLRPGCASPARLVPGPGVLALGLEPARLAFQRLELELADVRLRLYGR